MLKETPTSLRAYFGLVAFLSFLPVAAQLSEGTFDLIGALVGVAFGTLYAYVAIRMEYLLAKKPGFIRGVLLFNLALSLIAAIFAALNGQVWSSLPYVAVACAITAYLYSTVRRLSSTIAPIAPERPNKAPEPTPGAVTPRATEGTSK